MTAARVRSSGVNEDRYAWSVLRGTAGHHDVLRAFDQARRRIARKVVGHADAFAGFDTLMVDPRPSEAHSDVLLITATVVAQNENSHVVEYVATGMDGEQDDETGWPTSGAAGVVARGVGRTLHCRPVNRRASRRLTEQSEGDDK